MYKREGITISNVITSIGTEITRIIGGITRLVETMGNTIVGIIDSISGTIDSMGVAAERVMNSIGGVVDSVGNAIKGTIKSISDGIADIINSISNLETAGAEATTKQIKELSKIESGQMHKVAAGVEAMKRALDDFGGGFFSQLGGGILTKIFGDEGPIGKILQLAKNSSGIKSAADALLIFVSNVDKFKGDFEVSDKVIEGIQKVIKAFAGAVSENDIRKLKALSEAMDHVLDISPLDTTKIAAMNAFSKNLHEIMKINVSSLTPLSKINIPKIMPETADEYERILQALSSAKPDKINEVAEAINNATKAVSKNATLNRLRREPRSTRPVDVMIKSESTVDKTVSTTNKGLNAVAKSVTGEVKFHGIPLKFYSDKFKEVYNEYGPDGIVAKMTTKEGKLTKFGAAIKKERSLAALQSKQATQQQARAEFSTIKPTPSQSGNNITTATDLAEQAKRMSSQTVIGQRGNNNGNTVIHAPSSKNTHTSSGTNRPIDRRLETLREVRGG